MNRITLGIIKEGKFPPDFRVPLTPRQCKTVQILYPDVKIFVQRSPIRTYKDFEYEIEGIELVDSLENCDIILGVKEVNIDDLIPHKTYIFFSHTIKKQPHNQKLLRAILDKKIRLIDYELIKDKFSKRLIGFGRYAGIVGTYNGFLTWGLKTNSFVLKPAHLCENRQEVEAELKKVVLPNNFKCILTGFGRVGHGAREVIDLLRIKEITPDELFTIDYNEPVFAHLELEDYFGRKDGKEFNKQEFYSFPELYKSIFSKFISCVDMYIPCHFWSEKSPLIITKEDLKQSNRRLSLVADISCDVNGPIASTIRSSTIGDSIYGYDPQSGRETDFRNENAIAVMAVDNLPCELHRDASEDFGNELMKYLLPALLRDDPDRIIDRASETDLLGNLTENYRYLTDYANGVI
ncbi:MAG: alanine dehydrogenase [Bacteroidetes bacterium]|nr:alanine dehydrogenase [Bacteroidota bacterium]